jgi:molecular chaperone GrpE
VANFLKRLFGEQPEPVVGVTPEELKQEMSDLKKILRKQMVAMEMHKEEILDHVDTKSLKDFSHEALQDIADSFFHLEAAIRDAYQLSENQEQSFAISWTKIEQMLKLCGIEPVRGTGVPFDSRIHEAVSTRNGSVSPLQVERILQPGYLFKGKVVRPAKVALGAKDSE